MSAIEQPSLERRQLEELYRQQISAVRTLARLLGYPCPIVTRAERRTTVQDLDDCGIVEMEMGRPVGTGLLAGSTE